MSKTIIYENFTHVVSLYFIDVKSDQTCSFKKHLKIHSKTLFSRVFTNKKKISNEISISFAVFQCADFDVYFFFLFSYLKSNFRRCL